jgi:hypothetical protein
LLAQGDVFQAQPLTGENQPSQINGQEPHKREHALILADRNRLIQHTSLILMTDRSTKKIRGRLAVLRGAGVRCFGSGNGRTRHHRPGYFA